MARLTLTSPPAGRRVFVLAALLTLVALVAWAVVTPRTVDEGAVPGVALDAAPTQSHLEQHLQRHPTDARALVLQARLDLRADRYAAAAAGFDKALALSTKVARDANVWLEAAEARGLEQGSTLAGAPQARVAKALAIDPEHPRALDLAGSAAWEQRHFAAAARHWKRLLAQMSASDGRYAELTAAIERAERRARLSLPPP